MFEFVQSLWNCPGIVGLFSRSAYNPVKATLDKTGFPVRSLYTPVMATFDRIDVWA
jgi:hypothetical protein